jgi:hypothetical protein
MGVFGNSGWESPDTPQGKSFIHRSANIETHAVFSRVTRLIFMRVINSILRGVYETFFNFFLSVDRIVIVGHCGIVRFRAAPSGTGLGNAAAFSAACA